MTKTKPCKQLYDFWKLRSQPSVVLADLSSFLSVQIMREYEASNSANNYTTKYIFHRDKTFAKTDDRPWLDDLVTDYSIVNLVQILFPDADEEWAQKTANKKISTLFFREPHSPVAVQELGYQETNAVVCSPGKPGFHNRFNDDSDAEDKDIWDGE